MSRKNQVAILDNYLKKGRLIDILSLKKLKRTLGDKFPEDTVWIDVLRLLLTEFILKDVSKTIARLVVEIYKEDEDVSLDYIKNRIESESTGIDLDQYEDVIRKTYDKLRKRTLARQREEEPEVIIDTSESDEVEEPPKKRQKSQKEKKASVKKPKAPTKKPKLPKVSVKKPRAEKTSKSKEEKLESLKKAREKYVESRKIPKKGDPGYDEWKKEKIKNKQRSVYFQKSFMRDFNTVVAVMQEKGTAPKAVRKTAGGDILLVF